MFTIFTLISKTTFITKLKLKPDSKHLRTLPLTYTVAWPKYQPSIVATSESDSIENLRICLILTKDFVNRTQIASEQTMILNTNHKYLLQTCV